MENDMYENETEVEKKMRERQERADGIGKYPEE